MEAHNDHIWDKVLLSTFTVWKTRYKVFCHEKTLVWQNEVKSYIHFLPISDIIAVKYVHVGDESCCSISRSQEGLHQEFAIHYVDHDKGNDWRYKSVVLHSYDANQVKIWVETLNGMLREFQHRPKSILLFVNPFGGKKLGLKIYQEQVKPLMDLAGITVNLKVTMHKNHARDSLMEECLSHFNGIVCIGGDGTFAEVMNGLIKRTARDQGLDPNDPSCEPLQPKTRVGIIPGGSTDTVAYSIHGTTDVQTAVIHIIMGESTGLDICSVRSQDKLLCYYASVISYGYLGDTIRDSDNFRWMGPRRYDFSGLRKFLGNQGYQVEITLAVNPSIPKEDSKCYKYCKRCQAPQVRHAAASSKIEWKTIKGKFLMVNGANLSCACPRSPNGISPHTHMADGCMDVVLVKHTSMFNNLKLLLTLSSRWKSIYDLPFVEVHRTTQFSVKAVESPGMGTSVWNCDGEVLNNTSINIRCHRQLLDVFYRGAEPVLEEETAGCFWFM